MRLFFILLLLLQIRAFNINNIIYHAKLCKLTYNNNNTFIIHRKNNTLNICFRGTKNMNDFYLNLNIIPQSFIKKEIKVHKGFLYKYLTIRDLIINKTKEIISNNNIEDIYISGHSSGGAIANIASLDLYYLYPNIRINSITFGSPRMANKAFINEYNKYINNSIRIVNNNDIIQYLPIPIIYHHIHKPLILLDNVKKINIKYNHGINTYIKNLIIFNI
jgi:predicted lipase